jgi:hypothetical protein
MSPTRYFIVAFQDRPMLAVDQTGLVGIPRRLVGLDGSDLAPDVPESRNPSIKGRLGVGYVSATMGDSGREAGEHFGHEGANRQQGHQSLPPTGIEART